MKKLCIAFAGVLAVMSASVPAAHAHAGRTVGHYEMIVGWGNEPAYAGFANSVQMILHDHRTEKPVVDLTDSLKVDAKFGDQTKTMTFEPFFEVGEFGTPGDYRAFLVPTRPGTWTFRIYGTIHGDKVDVSIKSGETTFDDLKDPQEVKFPVQDPNEQQLNDKIDRGLARVDASAASAEDKASSAALPGWIGVGLGAVALILSLVALRKRSAA